MVRLKYTVGIAFCIALSLLTSCEKNKQTVVTYTEEVIPKYVPPRVVQVQENNNSIVTEHPFEPYPFPIVEPDYPPDIDPVTAKQIIEGRAKLVIQVIENIDMQTFSHYVHPMKGIKFGDSPRLDTKDKVFMKNEIIDFFKDNEIYLWGQEVPSGLDILLTKKDFFTYYIYHDFSKVVKIGYNQIITDNGYPETQFRDYPNSIIVEFGFPNVKNLFDWEGFRIVFQEYENVWYVVAILRSTYEPG